ncbi:MAG: hypothetical protein L0Y56_09745, partial [Nitrospira sp.]|nr:hypothetical protein [Nitrospira sp.]
MSVYLITLFFLLGGLCLALSGFFIGMKWGTTRQQVLDAADHESYKARFMQERAFRRALNLELHHLREENKKYMNLFVNLPDAVKRLHAYQTIPEAIAAIVRLTKDVLNPNQIAFFLQNQETNLLELKAGYNLPFQTPADYGVILGEGPIGLTAAHRMFMTRKDFEHASLPAESSHLWLDSYMCAPIVYEEKLMGVLSIGQVHEETGREQTLLAMIVDIAAIDLQNATARQSIEKEAITDPLTGLFNRRYFFHRLPDELKRAQNYQFP